MISRRQFMFNGVAGTFAPNLTYAARKVEPALLDYGRMSSMLNVHSDVLRGLTDRIKDVIPEPSAVLWASPQDRVSSFHGDSPFAGMQQRGSWRFLPDIDDASQCLLTGAMGFCCSRLTKRLDLLNVLRFNSGCTLAGMTMLHYKGIDTSIMLLLPGVRYGFRPKAFLLNG